MSKSLFPKLGKVDYSAQTNHCAFRLWFVNIFHREGKQLAGIHQIFPVEGENADYLSEEKGNYVQCTAKCKLRDGLFMQLRVFKHVHGSEHRLLNLLFHDTC